MNDPINIRSWRVLALLSLAITLASRTASAESSHDELVSKFGISLEGRDDERWSAEDLATISETLSSLPESLATIGKRTRFRAIRLFKTHSAEEGTAHHTAPAVLYWQLTISLPEAAPHLAQLTGKDADAVLKRSYATLLKRRFVHQLLHVYDAIFKRSDEVSWRSLSGWRPRAYFGIEIPFLLKEASNQDPRGFADELGLRSPEEDFVTFGELFFVTPDTRVEDSIACRTPDKFNHFRRLFPEYRPYLDQPHITCRGADEGFLDDLTFLDPITRKPIDLGPINEDTVIGFELLYATPGVGDAAEIAGHLVLRMKLANNPQAARFGVENPNDLVLSFLADTEAGLPARRERGDVKIPQKCRAGGFAGWLDGFLGGGIEDAQSENVEFDSFRAILQALKGLSGGFLTTFDRQTLAQAVRTYTIDQDRNLLRYELKLSREQRAKLIQRLYIAKKSYRTKYYFFDRNCASILVQLLGEALGDDEIVSFDPFVVPPNALVALLLRKGIATPAHPAFYSYRKRGHVAEDVIRKEYPELTRANASAMWPSLDQLLNKSDATRATAFKQLLELSKRQPSLNGALFRLAALAQDAELTHVDKDQICEQMTSNATAAQRELQRAILSNDASIAKRFAINTNQVIYDRFRDLEEHDASTGSTHTHLASIRVGVGRLSDDFDEREWVGTVSGALHRQEMGAISAQSMQRATFVSLGAASITLGKSGGDAQSSRTLKEWSVTGLSLRKFKERLYDVPSYWEDDGGLGLGLTVLDIRGSKRRGFVKGTLLGGELLANLLSSRLYNRYLFLSLGIQGVGDWPTAERGDLATREERLHIQIPMRLEALWTFDGQRRWQLRTDGTVRFGRPRGDFEREIEGHAQMTHRLATGRGSSEFLIWCGGEFHGYPSGGLASGLSRLWQIGMEWIPW